MINMLTFFFKQKIWLTLLLSFVFLHPSSLLMQDEHGWAYLVRVVNQTNFKATLSFAKDLGSFEIGAGESLGETTSAADMVGDFLAPVNAIKMTRIWQNNKDLTAGKDSKLNKRPKLSGAAIKEINNFDAGQLLMLQAMRNSAIAWLVQQDLTNPQKPVLDMTISFLAYVRDEGDVQIILSEQENVGSLWTWKIAFSSSPNGFARIFKKNKNQEQVVAEVANREFAQARLVPGKMNKLWVSFKGNRVILGSGIEGQNPFLTWEDVGNVKPMKRLGLSCGETPVTIARIATMSAIFPQAIGKPIAVLQANSLQNNELVLREPGLGGLIWNQNDNFDLQFFSNTNPEQKITLSVNENTATAKYFDSQGKAINHTFSINSTLKTFWLALENGQLLFGQGVPSVEGLMLFEQTPNNKDATLCKIIQANFLQHADKIKFSVTPTNGLYFFSKIKMSALTWQGSAKQQPLFNGKINIYQPYAYEISQDGPVINGKDLISGKTYLLGKAPQQGAIYPFELLMESDGEPKMKWHNKPINVGKFFMNIAATGLRIAEAQLYGKAEEMPNKDTSQMEEDLASTQTNIQFALAGGAVGAIASMMEAEADLGFRDGDAFGYTEQIKQSIASKDSDKKSQELAEQVRLLLNKAAALDLKLKDDLDYAFQLYSDTLSSLKDFSILTDVQRQEIINQFKAIALSAILIYKNPRMVANKISRLFIAALTNPYFFNRNNIAHKVMSDSLNAAMQKVFARIFFELGRGKIYLPQTNGQFIWTGKKLQNEGSVFFRAKSAGGFLAQFIQAQGEATNAQLGEQTWLEPGSAAYEIGFGLEKNSMLCVKVSHLGKPVQKVISSKNPAVAISSLKSKPFWINFSSGTISVGQGDWGQGQILEWTDPYPQGAPFFIGFASINGIVELEDVRFGPPIHKLNDQIIKGKTDDEVAREKILLEETTKTGLTQIDLKNIDLLAKQKNPLEKDFLEDKDPLKYDLLAITDSELKYGNPLEWSDLDMAQYKREEKEQAIIKQFYETKKADRIDEDAELALKKSELAKNQELRADQQSRGATQKADAAGIFGIKQELQQISKHGLRVDKSIKEMVSMDINKIKPGGSEITGLKDAFSFNRRLTTTTANKAEKDKQAVDRDRQGYAQAEARIDEKAAAASKQARVTSFREVAEAAITAKKAAETDLLRRTADSIAEQQLARKSIIPQVKTEPVAEVDANVDSQEQLKRQKMQKAKPEPRTTTTAGTKASTDAKVVQEEPTQKLATEDPFAYENIDRKKYALGTSGEKGVEAINAAKDKAVKELEKAKNLNAEVEALKKQLVEQPEDKKDPTLVAALKAKEEAAATANKEADAAIADAKNIFFAQHANVEIDENGKIIDQQSERSKVFAEARVKLLDAEFKLQRLQQNNAAPEAIKKQQQVIAMLEDQLQKYSRYSEAEMPIIARRDNLKAEIEQARNQIAELENLKSRTAEQQDELGQIKADLKNKELELINADKEAQKIDDYYDGGAIGKAKTLAKSFGINILQGLVPGILSGSGDQASEEAQAITKKAAEDAASKLRRLGGSDSFDRN